MEKREGKPTIFPDRRIRGEHFPRKCGINQTRMYGEDRNTARIPLHVEMQNQQIHGRLTCRIPRQVADVRVAQRATDINDLHLMVPALDCALVQNSADDLEGPYGVRLEDFGKHRWSDGRGRCYLMADCGGADDDVDFSRRADYGLHGSAISDIRGVHRDLHIGVL